MIRIWYNPVENRLIEISSGILYEFRETLYSGRTVTVAMRRHGWIYIGEL